MSPETTAALRLLGCEVKYSYMEHTVCVFLNENIIAFKKYKFWQHNPPTCPEPIRRILERENGRITQDQGGDRTT